MTKTFSINRMLIFIVILIALPFSLFGDYNFSDKYAYSFYVPAEYKKTQVTNDYGPFFQYSNTDGSMFIHFWARGRPHSAKLNFLKDAYEADFLKYFLDDRKYTSDKQKTSLKNVNVYYYNVSIQEKPYKGEVYYFQKKKLFFTLAFFYTDAKKKKLKRDRELLIYSLIYGN